MVAFIAQTLPKTFEWYRWTFSSFVFYYIASDSRVFDFSSIGIRHSKFRRTSNWMKIGESKKCTPAIKQWMNSFVISSKTFDYIIMCSLFAAINEIISIRTNIKPSKSHPLFSLSIITLHISVASFFFLVWGGKNK